MTGSIASFSLMGVGGRELAAELTTFEIMTWRSLMGLVVVAGAAVVLGRTEAMRPRRLGLHLARNTAHFAGQNLWFWALTAIPLVQVFAIEFTSPLWVALAAPLLLGERLTRTRVTAALAGFAGVLVVTRPFGGALDPGQVAAALAALCFAATNVATKRLTQSESTLAILFWLTAMQAVMGLAATLPDGEIAAPSAALMPWMAVVGLAGLTAHLCLTAALSLAPASVVVPMDFVRLPVIALVGAVLYGEGLDPWVLAGAAVILAANWVNVAQETRSGRMRAPRGP
jgi:drug/metabolite transporter (DMT)-like permease